MYIVHRARFRKGQASCGRMPLSASNSTILGLRERTSTFAAERLQVAGRLSAIFDLETAEAPEHYCLFFLGLWNRSATKPQMSVELPCSGAFQSAGLPIIQVFIYHTCGWRQGRTEGHRFRRYRSRRSAGFPGRRAPRRWVSARQGTARRGPDDWKPFPAVGHAKSVSRMMEMRFV